jgi:hypothetical protein
MAFIIAIGAIVIDHDKASPSFRRDRDSGAGTSASSSGGTTTGEACGTSSSSGALRQDSDSGGWDLLFLQQDHDSGAL